MLFDKALVASLLACAVKAVPITKRGFSYGTTPVRGVNIGGWLVLEPWITPSIFEQFPAGNVVDEYTLCKYAGNAESILQSHWSSWATERDFQKIADNGFNLVRIPIGYWAFQKFDADDYIQGAAEYMDQAITWARSTGLKVWVDLHGAPLSQNGYDNSGERLDTPGWTTGSSVSQTQTVISQIAERYSGDTDVVAGIEVINEPIMSELAGGKGATQGYYQNAFDSIKSAGNLQVVIQDGFAEPSSWNGFLTGQGNNGAILAHHEYQAFAPADLQLSYSEHVSAVYSKAQTWATGQDKFLINGEWTAAMTDCAPGLNGWGIGAQYDGTFSKRNADGSYDSSTYIGSCATKNFIDEWDNDMKTATTNYIKAQIDVAESMIQGWIFWNFKTEASAEWDLFRLLDNGIWPQ